MEEWRAVVGYEGKYLVSNLGRVQSIVRRKPHICSQSLIGGHGNSKYCRVSLWDGSKQTDYLVHRLVAVAFLPNPENKPQVNHIDGNKQNNRIENLEWNTSSENHIHARSVLGHHIGSKNGRSKFSPEQIMTIRELGKTESGAEIARRLNVHKTTICRILANTTYHEVHTPI